MTNSVNISEQRDQLREGLESFGATLAELKRFRDAVTLKVQVEAYDVKPSDFGRIYDMRLPHEWIKIGAGSICARPGVHGILDWQVSEGASFTCHVPEDYAERSRVLEGGAEVSARLMGVKGLDCHDYAEAFVLHMGVVDFVQDGYVRRIDASRHPVSWVVPANVPHGSARVWTHSEWTTIRLDTAASDSGRTGSE